MKLYYNPLSTFSQKVLIALYEKAIAFKPEVVMMMNPEAKAAYKKLYPFGKIPMLLLDDGTQIGESSIIIEYLEDSFTSTVRLIPENKNQAREVRLLDRVCDHYLNEPCYTIFMDSIRPAHEKTPLLVQEARQRLEVTYDFLSERLSGRTWLAGETFTLADCSAAPVLNYLQGMHDFNRHVQITSYMNRIRERASFMRVLTELKPHMDAFFASQK